MQRTRHDATFENASIFELHAVLPYHLFFFYLVLFILYICIFIFFYRTRQDDTFDDSSIFSVGSMGSATTNGGAGGRVPSSPSTQEAMDQSDDEEEDEELRGRWGNNGVVVAGEEKHGDGKPGIHVGFFFFGRLFLRVPGRGATIYEKHRFIRNTGLSLFGLQRRKLTMNNDDHSNVHCLIGDDTVVDV